MKILWIPNSPGGPGHVTRDEHFIRYLKRDHGVYRLTWDTREAFRRPGSLLNALRFYRQETGGYTTFHVRRAPDLTRWIRRDRFRASWLNETLFRRDLQHILRNIDIDVMVTAYTEFMTGRPPFEGDTPIVFDYMDCGKWDEHPDRPEAEYLRRSDGVLGVSQLALERAREYNDSVFYLPNGVDLDRFAKARGEPVREKHELGDAPVLSLIGLGRAHHLYFLEGVRRAAREVPGLKCLLVGESELLRKELGETEGSDSPFILTGPIPYEEIPSYFAATDVGLFPVVQDQYNDGRSPIKVFEYTAMDSPIVMPPVRETEHLDFDNFVFVEPNADSFAEGIVRAVDQGPTPEPRIEEFDLPALAEGLVGYLRNHVESSGDP